MPPVVACTPPYDVGVSARDARIAGRPDLQRKVERTRQGDDGDEKARARKELGIGWHRATQKWSVTIEERYRRVFATLDAAIKAHLCVCNGCAMACGYWKLCPVCRLPVDATRQISDIDADSGTTVYGKGETSGRDASVSVPGHPLTCTLAESPGV